MASCQQNTGSIGPGRWQHSHGARGLSQTPVGRAGQVLVVPRRRSGDSLELPPAQVVRAEVVLQFPALIVGITQGQHQPDAIPRRRREKSGRRLVVPRPADLLADIPRRRDVVAHAAGPAARTIKNTADRTNIRRTISSPGSRQAAAQRRPRPQGSKPQPFVAWEAARGSRPHRRAAHRGPVAHPGSSTAAPGLPPAAAPIRRPARPVQRWPAEPSGARSHVRHAVVA